MVGVLASVACLGIARAADAPRRPNILLITSDQQHWNTLGSRNPEIRTPHLDQRAHLTNHPVAFGQSDIPAAPPAQPLVPAVRYEGAWTDGDHHSAAALELWLTNDRQRSVVDRVTVTLGTFDGRTDWRDTREVTIDAGASACVWQLPPLATSPSHYVWVASENQSFPSNRHFFAKTLRWRPARRTVSSRLLAAETIALRR